MQLFFLHCLWLQLRIIGATISWHCGCLLQVSSAWWQVLWKFNTELSIGIDFEPVTKNNNDAFCENSNVFAVRGHSRIYYRNLTVFFLNKNRLLYCTIGDSFNVKTFFSLTFTWVHYAKTFSMIIIINRNHFHLSFYYYYRPHKAIETHFGKLLVLKRIPYRL